MIVSPATARPARPSTTRLLSAAALLLLGLCSTACNSLVIPAHPRSYDDEGEQVAVRFLTLEDLKGFEDDWKGAYGPEAEMKPLEIANNAKETKVRSAGASALSLLIPLAADYVTERIDEEANRYEAQYEARQTVDDFWERAQTADGKKSTWKQRYLGVELTRSTKQTRAGSKPAFRIVLGLSKVAELDRLKLAPLRLEMNSAKAKILDTNAWSFLPPLLWHHLLESGSEVQVDLGLQTTTGAIGSASEGAVDATTAPKSLELPHYDLDAPTVWHAATADGPIHRKVVGVLPLPMISSKTREDGSIESAGVLEVALVVTERDPSNARKYLKKLSAKVKEKAQSLAAKYAEPPENKDTGDGSNPNAGPSGSGRETK